jgi:hypothetical protein
MARVYLCYWRFLRFQPVVVRNLRFQPVVVRNLRFQPVVVRNLRFQPVVVRNLRFQPTRRGVRSGTCDCARQKQNAGRNHVEVMKRFGELGLADCRICTVDRSFGLCNALQRPVLLVSQGESWSSLDTDLCAVLAVSAS